MRIATDPAKADAPLIVDPNAVLAFAIAFERFEAICRRRAQIVERSGVVEHTQLSSGNELDILGKRRENAPPQIFSASLSEKLRITL